MVRRLGFRSYLCIPLTARGRALGVLTLIGTDGHRRYDAADLALAEELARRAALAVDNARLYRAAGQARQEAEAADRAKGRFLAVLSHELRNPLSPVLMAVSALLDGDEMLGLRPTLEMIRRNVELEARLIDDLLDVTRIGRGTLHLDPRTVDAHDAVRQAVHICLGEIEQGRIALESDLAATEHYVEADPARLQQIIWNLIKNATKFTPPGGSITVRSRNRPDPRPGGRPRLVIEVADDGAGIEAEALTRIFEPFEQGEVSPRHRSGLGLGLAIGRSLAEAHGGRLTAASTGPGRGSIFRLELPTITRLTVVDAALGLGHPSPGAVEGAENPPRGGQQGHAQVHRLGAGCAGSRGDGGGAAFGGASGRSRPAFGPVGQRHRAARRDGVGIDAATAREGTAGDRDERVWVGGGHPGEPGRGVRRAPHQAGRRDPAHRRGPQRHRRRVRGSGRGSRRRGRTS